MYPKEKETKRDVDVILGNLNEITETAVS